MRQILCLTVFYVLLSVGCSAPIETANESQNEVKDLQDSKATLVTELVRLLEVLRRRHENSLENGAYGEETDDDVKRTFDSLGGYSIHPSKRNFDSLGGYSIHPNKRHFDSLGGFAIHPGKRNFDSLGGYAIHPEKRHFDSLGGFAIHPGKRHFDSLGGFAIHPGKRHFDSLGGFAIHPGKRHFDSLGGFAIHPGKRHFDSLGGFAVHPGKRHFDSLGGFAIHPGKRHFDSLGGFAIHPGKRAGESSDESDEAYSKDYLFDGGDKQAYWPNDDDLSSVNVDDIESPKKRRSYFDSLGGYAIHPAKRTYNSIDDADDSEDKSN